MTDLDNREKDIREILDDDEWYENDESRDTLADPGDDIWMGRKSERLAALLNPSPVPDSGLALLTDEECSQAVQQDVGKWAVTSKYFIMDLARVIAKAQARKQQAATSKDDMDYYNGVLHKFHLMGKAEVAAAVKDNNIEIVHHEDENKANDDLANLTLFPTQSAHAIHHGLLRRNLL